MNNYQKLILVTFILCWINLATAKGYEFTDAPADVEAEVEYEYSVKRIHKVASCTSAEMQWSITGGEIINELQNGNTHTAIVKWFNAPGQKKLTFGWKLIPLDESGACQNCQECLHEIVVSPMLNGWCSGNIAEF